MKRERPAAPDQAQRDAAIAERERNVLVDAGAGTGKTSLLVRRLVNMVAPEHGHDPIDIGRIAAITFTRKAAGELRLRIRERLLEDLAGARGEREARLRAALAGLDTAYVGTIHSFADRLLRLRPVEARLSPSYAIAEDDEALVRETFEVIAHAVEEGRLAGELLGGEAADRAEEAEGAWRDAIFCGLRAESEELEWGARWGLDALVAELLRHRDLPPPDQAPAAPDLDAFRRAAGEFVARARDVPGDTRGGRWIRATARLLQRLGESRDPVAIARELWRQDGRAPNGGLRENYGGDRTSDAWKVWKAYHEGKGRDGGRPLRDDLRGPLDRWMAARLARLFPVACGVYRRVKRRRRALDTLDLLERLRDLVRDHRDARGGYQRMFGHVFVDEFQDTDPLQAEVVLYLCEREPRARDWREVELAAGRLTLVGDPKQSIYRFRRADVAMYDAVRAIVARQGALEVTLSANFRSVPPLIEWFNDRFARDCLLGASPDGRRFDREQGRVYHQDLAPGREGPAAPAVRVLRYDLPGERRPAVDALRGVEARALAAYLRHVVAGGGAGVVDPVTGDRRAARYGDVAVLAVSTWRLPLLFPRLDEAGIPYASRGGTLFLQDDLHRRLLLALRAVADRDDGVAEAALLRAPFFAIDPGELWRAREARRAGGTVPEAVAEARALVTDLRRRRHARPPGATARDLVERTAIGRVAATGPNGAQRVARLRELCFRLDRVAEAEGLDYDAATARLRAWVEQPPQLDPPHPVGGDAVQVLTVHQAKGLEFPIVALWDGSARIAGGRDMGSAWRVDRDGRGWQLGLEGLRWEEPPGLALAERELAYRNAEMRRIVYVAATRARDLLIVPRAGDPTDNTICGALLRDAPGHLAETVDSYVEGQDPPAWAVPPASARAAARDAAEVEREVAARWVPAAAAAAAPRFSPASVTEQAHAAQDEEGGSVSRRERPGRFGPAFGTAVHEAIGMVLRAPAVGAEEAARRAALAAGLQDHVAEVAADAGRALAALRVAGLARVPGPDLRIEYPIAAAADGRLTAGYIDLVAVTGDRVDVIDFKSDAPPGGDAQAAYPEYCRQVRAYAALLSAAGLTAGRTVRLGLLFTADGVIRWLAP